MAKRFGEAIPLDNWYINLKWMIARETGWTLEYIESLSLGQLWEFVSVLESDNKASRSRQVRREVEAAAKPKPKGLRGRRR